MNPATAITQLQHSGCRYAFYYAPKGGAPVFHSNVDPHARFLSASIIKVPILLAWVHLERQGLASRAELCDLDAETQVKGAGFSWLLHGRHIPYADVLLMMIALSDNLCTNLVIRRVGLERLNQVFRDVLELRDTALERKLFDYEARARGLDNWVSTADLIRLYDLIDALEPGERAWVEQMLEVNQDDALLKRNVPRDTIVFRHKTGSIEGVLNDWGYTDQCKIFLLTNNVPDEQAVFPIFGNLGELMMEE